jgi:hypothetical protein
MKRLNSPGEGGTMVPAPSANLAAEAAQARERAHPAATAPPAEAARLRRLLAASTVASNEEAVTPAAGEVSTSRLASLEQPRARLPQSGPAKCAGQQAHRRHHGGTRSLRRAAAAAAGPAKGKKAKRMKGATTSSPVHRGSTKVSAVCTAHHIVGRRIEYRLCDYNCEGEGWIWVGGRVTAAHGDPASQSWGSWVKVALDYSDQPESWRRSVRVCADAYGEVWRYGTEEEEGGGHPAAGGEPRSSSVRQAAAAAAAAAATATATAEQSETTTTTTTTAPSDDDEETSLWLLAQLPPGLSRAKFEAPHFRGFAAAVVDRRWSEYCARPENDALQLPRDPSHAMCSSMVYGVQAALMTNEPAGRPSALAYRLAFL